MYRQSSIMFGYLSYLWHYYYVIISYYIKYTKQGTRCIELNWDFKSKIYTLLNITMLIKIKFKKCYNIIIILVYIIIGIHRIWVRTNKISELKKQYDPYYRNR